MEYCLLGLGDCKIVTRKAKRAYVATSHPLVVCREAPRVACMAVDKVVGYWYLCRCTEGLYTKKNARKSRQE